MKEAEKEKSLFLDLSSVADSTKAILPIRRALPAIKAMAPNIKGTRAAAFKAINASIGPRILAAFFFLPRLSSVTLVSSLPNKDSETSSKARPVELTACTISDPFSSTLIVCVFKKPEIRFRASDSNVSSPEIARP
uniref:Uncharacterized protein n=1 Tax=Glossina austeni TaxID=7395 RepID=A0A1A9VIX1_GLOAU